MFLFIILYFGINFLSAVGYGGIFRINSDRKLFWYFWLTALIPIVLFFTAINIMAELITTVFIYQVVGILLYLGECFKYKKEQETERESW